MRLGSAARGTPVSDEARGRGGLFHILDLDGFSGHPLRQCRGHEAVEIAVEHVARRVDVTPVRRSFTS